VGAPEWKRKLISDPQTSGGLLVACAPGVERRVIEEFHKQGFSLARRIGSIQSGEATVTVV
jgi:selenide,water dikinase